jgi:hypothetical protein
MKLTEAKSKASPFMTQLPLMLLTFTFSPRTLNFSLNLNLSEGTHNITVRVEAESYYVTPGYLTGPPFSITVYGEPELVNFTVAQPEPETEPSSVPFPVVLVAAASVALAGVIVAGLLVYFKKYHGNKSI